MNYNNQPSSFDRLIESLGQHTLKLVVTFLFSVCLIGGSSFILFEATAEVDRIKQVILENTEHLNEFGSFIEMQKIIGYGWIYTDGNLDQITALYAELLNRRNSGQVDIEFSRNAIDWCTKSLSQLRSEKGQISGYVFSTETQRLHQVDNVTTYDAYIKAVEGINEFVGFGEDELPEDRNARLRSIKIAIDQASEASTAAKARLSLFSDHEEQQIRLGIERVDNELDLLKLKINLSFVGIAVGVIILGVIIFRYFRYIRRSRLRY